MGLLDKLFFWKHREESFDLPRDLETPSMEAPPSEMPPSFPERPSFAPPEPPLRPAEPSFGSQPLSQSIGGVPVEKELQLITAKLDAIKASLETINVKLEKFERKEETRWR